MLNENEIRFIADDMLGRLAKWLRIFGFDVLYHRSINDNDLIEKANSTGRILLTRDTKIASSGGANRCILVIPDNYREQLKQLFRLLNLNIDRQCIFSRCLICNELLKTTDKENVKGKVPPFVFEKAGEFMRCEKCDKIYWRGTHIERVEKFISELAESSDKK